MTHQKKLPWFFGALFVALGIFPASSQDRDVYAVFEAHDPSSVTRIDYNYWTEFLRGTVLNTGPSNRFSRSPRVRITGTRLRLHNPNRSWLEGNRVLFHELTDEHIASITEYKAELESLPQTLPYASLNRREQLAYWLNLYTVTVYLEMAQSYPMVRLKRLYLGHGNQSGLGVRKLVTVLGVAMSLNEIRDRILIPIWKNPVVLYGLYHGAVGGPNIRRTAYSGANVWSVLEDNAFEYVNSIRGVHLRNGKISASRIYEWGALAFPAGEVDVLRHLYKYGDQKTREILDTTDQFSISYFDWYVADLYNGRPNWVSMYPVTVTSPDGISSHPTMPPHTLKFLQTLRLRFRIYGPPTGRVTVEELPRDGETTGDPDGEEKKEDNEPPPVSR